MSRPTANAALPLPPIAEHIWDSKYRLKSADGAPLDATLEDTWHRVARAAAQPETRRLRSRWEERFFEAMRDLAFLPAGRIIAGAGTGRNVTLFNCFVMGRIEDDLSSIFDNVKEAALTMQRGGGIGHDFSTLRPSGTLVRSVGAGASGPVSFMDVWDAMCRTIMSAGQRRGAMMGTLRCDHPDIEAFIDAKAEVGRLRNFNMSVLVTDAFMDAVRADRDWPLSFGGTIVRTVGARDLWDRIMRATYAYAEPGVIFIDRINAANNLAYCETIQATNPCGEQPLPPYGACLLGSLNLARLVKRPFEPEAELDESRLAELAELAVRFLDNVIDVSAYPLSAQRKEAKAKRRIGLGMTGLADALAMCGARYGSSEAQRLAGRWMATIERHAYIASASLASEKGAFPLYEAEPFLSSPNVRRLDADVRDAITRCGMRNGCVTSIAPTGTISLLAGNVSSGIEPIFDYHYQRRVRGAGDSVRVETVEDYAYRQYRALSGPEAPLPASFVTANQLSPSEHLLMQAAVQAHVDSSISKTINCAEEMSFEAFKTVYAEAYDLGLKGCTTFRPNPVTGSVLSTPAAAPSGPQSHDPTTPLTGAADASRSDAFAPSVVASAEADPHSRDRPGVVYISPPLERDPVLSGFTYKLKWADSDHAIYVTINDIEREGRRRPFEIFINTKNLEHYAWTVALTRMISAVFRRGGDVSFVVEELKAVFDPQGGQWMGGRYVPSLLAAIGEIIERHLLRIGFLRTPLPLDQTDDPTASVHPPQSDASVHNTESGSKVGRRCPRCHVGNLIAEAGCWICRDCGYAKCG
ncbi:MAG: adenosylcobalamin-dependent ribonucleoside-diphosphate reductase [Hyphomicrobiaceae bacterium]